MNEPTSTSSQGFRTERSLSAQRLAQYVARGRCERHLRFGLFPSEAQELLRRYGLQLEPLSPLLSVSGQQFEQEALEELSKRASVRDLSNTPPEAFVSEVRAQGLGRTFYYQPTLRGRIGLWDCEGRADLIEITRDADGGPITATVIDVKASARETVGFRLQVAFYVRLLEATLREAGLTFAPPRGAVAARDSLPAEDGGWKTFDLSLYLDEMERLVAAPDSDVARAARAEGGAARYHLRPSCDGCPYNQLCFADTAEREDLSLVPYLTVSEKRALGAEGISSARRLAGLMRYAEGGGMEAVPGREEEARRVGSRWPLAARLPLLAQRARAAVSRLDRSVASRRHVVGSDYGSLPDTSAYPDMVRVFVDAQRDYLQDRLYLLAARVVGPHGASEVVEMAAGPPDDDAERTLLVSWLQRLLPSIASAATSAKAPLHVYTFAPRGERAMLDALARHFDALCAVPAFHDLLTSHPALSQSMVSLLSEEARSRLNLAPVCQNLYEVAQSLGFAWSEGENDFRKIFRARVFDNRRTFLRDRASGALVRDGVKPEADEETDGDAPPPFVRIESAARFGAEIPLEYAYAAWGLVRPPSDAKGLSQLRGFLGVTAEQIRSFAAHRTRAMQHVEESFAYKSRAVEKEPLDLSRLHEVSVEPEEVPLRRSLEDFLLLEHHASLQERLLHLSLPPRERAETGRSATLVCERYERDDERVERAWFRLSDVGGRDAAPERLAPLRFRAGDWTVLNPLMDDAGRPLSGMKLVRGRLAVVEEIEDARVRLRLMPMSFKNSPFRYAHRLFAPGPGVVYTLDEMADDLNADKFLEACRHAETNHLYRWLCDEDEGKRQRAVRPARLRAAREFARFAATTQRPHGLTGAQSSVVGEHLTDRVLVVQGPPGTGKSHTVGFAVLARALSQATPARPFRVAVLARTHAAVAVALRSISRRRSELLAAHEDESFREELTPEVSKMLSGLDGLKIAKVCNDAGEEVPAGVERLMPDGDEEWGAAQRWEMLMGEPLLIVGGTPGGLYRLVKQGSGRGGKVDWTAEHFDLVVVDEASQMGLAEALTAAAFLRSDGQFVAVGDHRQMPPILAHAWDQESRRDLRRARPHLSIFEYLREAGFARAALDESFRIPAEVADFLRRHVYAEDGIDFRSSNRRRLPEATGIGEEWLRAALAPDSALVVIEHDESGSQQSNEFEARLVESIVRAATGRLGLDAARGVGVVVPHRAQKALLASRLPSLADSVDTVERFQGGERELIVVSATVSDLEFAASESSFLLEPRRLTVAVSRPMRKLIVIASRAVFDLIPADLDEYERGALWKHLRHECAGTALWEGEVDGHAVTVRAMGAGA